MLSTNKVKRYIAFVLLTYTFYSCQSKTKVQVYVAGCDSIFLSTNSVPNRNDIMGSSKDDSLFVERIVDVGLSSHEVVLIKPFGGNCGGVAETATNLVELLKKRNVSATIEMPDSTEEEIFNDVSFEKAFNIMKNNIKLNVPAEDESDTLDLKTKSY